MREKHGAEGLNKLFENAKKNGYKGLIARDDFKIAKPYPIEDFLIRLKTCLDLYEEADFDKM